MQGIHSNKSSYFLTILDIVITDGWSAGGEEQADQPHPHPEGLLEGAGGRCEKSHGGRLPQGVKIAGDHI